MRPVLIHCLKVGKSIKEGSYCEKVGFEERKIGGKDLKEENEVK